jgi:hypothetical protein
MPVTSPDSISYPDTSTTGGWVAAILATVTSIQAAFSKRGRHNFQWADATARAAQAGMIAGDEGYQVDVAITYRYNGSAWKEWDSDWISWATAPTNITVGTGGSAASIQRYKWIAGRIYFDFKFVLGSSGASVATGPVLNLPISVAIPVTNGITTGDGSIRDVSVPSTPAFTKATLLTATTVGLFTYTGTTANITATAPMTWAAGDIFAGGFWAEPA